jgi:hypothetical protein
LPEFVDHPESPSAPIFGLVKSPKFCKAAWRASSRTHPCQHAPLNLIPQMGLPFFGGIVAPLVSGETDFAETPSLSEFPSLILLLDGR